MEQTHASDLMKFKVHWGRQTLKQDITLVLTAKKGEAQSPREMQEGTLTRSSSFALMLGTSIRQ